MLVAYKFPHTYAMQEMGTGNTTNTRYPNLFAEWAASPFHLWVLCDHAGVERNVMKAVLYDGEKLLTEEALGLSQLFNVSMNCLFSPGLNLIAGERLHRKAYALFSLYEYISGRKEYLNKCQCIDLNNELYRIHRLLTTDIATCADYRWCRKRLLDLLEALNIPQRRNTLLTEVDI